MTKKPKHALKLIALLVGLASMPVSQAFLLPDVDAAKMKLMVTENLTRTMESAQKIATKLSETELKGISLGLKVDGFNNATANTIARLQQSETDVHNIDQESNARPVQDACKVIGMRETSARVSASQGELMGIISESKKGNGSNSILGRPDNQKELVASINHSPYEPYRIAASSTKVEKSRSEKDMDLFNLEIEKAIDKHTAWEKVGENPSDPRLLMITDSLAPIYDANELDMALNMAKIVYPRFVRNETTDHENEREIAQDLRTKGAIESANEVIVRHITLRAAPEEGMPSKLMALSMPTQMYMQTNGNLFGDDQLPWMDKVMLEGNTTPGEISRDKLLIKATKLEQNYEAYKSSLIKEKMLLTWYMSKVDSFK